MRSQLSGRGSNPMTGHLKGEMGTQTLTNTQKAVDRLVLCCLEPSLEQILSQRLHRGHGQPALLPGMSSLQTVALLVSAMYVILWYLPYKSPGNLIMEPGRKRAGKRELLQNKVTKKLL